MKNQLLLSILSLLIAFPLALVAQTAAFTYQGRLLDGILPANGSYDLRLQLANAPTNGYYIAPPLTNAPVIISNGVFVVLLDFGSEAFDGSPRWLEIGVRTNGDTGPYTMLNPRQGITAAPQALFANTASNAVVAMSLVPGVSILADGAGITNLNGAFIQAGTINSNQLDIATAAQLALGENTNVPYVTPQQFGAKGNAVTDDTGALQAWLSYASSNKLRAYLPPAPGGYYVISGELFVTNGIYLFGAAGSKQHNNITYRTKSCIMQTARNTTALHLLNAVDSLHIDNIAITTPVSLLNNFTNTSSVNQLNGNNFGVGCYGIYLDGGTDDADCSLIEQVLVTGFGIGCEVGGAAVTKFSCCSFGYNGIGLQINGPTMNDFCVTSCSIGANYFNNVSLIGVDNIAFIETDFVANSATPLCHNVNVGQSTSATFLGCRFEDYTTNTMLQTTPRSIGAFGVKSITCIDTAFESMGITDRYKVAITNLQSFCMINCYFDTQDKQVLVYTPVDTSTKRTFSIPPRLFTNASTGTLVSEWASAVDSKTPSQFIGSGSLSNSMFAPGELPSVISGLTDSVFDGIGGFLNYRNGMLISRSKFTQWDADATNFLTRANWNISTEDVTASAINTLVLSAKAHGWWTNCDAIYPFIGSSAAVNQLNLKTNAWSIIFHGCSHGSNGVTTLYSNSDYMDSTFIPNANTMFGTNGSHILGYGARNNTNTASGSWSLFGVYTPQKTCAYVNGATTFVAFDDDYVTLSTLSPYNLSAAFAITRTDSSNIAGYFPNMSGAKFKTKAIASTGVPMQSIYFCQMNNSGAPYGTCYCSGTWQAYTIGGALNGIMFTNMWNDFALFQAALGR